VHDKGQGSGPREEVGTVLTPVASSFQMLQVEAVRRAQERFGKGKPMTGEQVRWGLENLALDQKQLDALGFAGVLRPVKTSCFDHLGASWATHPDVGRREVGRRRLVRGRSAVDRADGQGGSPSVCGREEAHAPHDPRIARAERAPQARATAGR